MEIVVKKINATKGIINQMPSPKLIQLKDGDVLGMVINVVKDQHKTMIISCTGEFYRMAMDWQKGTKVLLRKVGRWTSEWRFETPEMCDEFWNEYERCVKIAETKHLYI